jgi:histidinol dehydrogenase
MLTRTDLRSGLPASAALRALLSRAEVDVDVVLERVRPIVAEVAERGPPMRCTWPST